jgi:hypothetical protein
MWIKGITHMIPFAVNVDKGDHMHTRKSRTCASYLFVRSVENNMLALVEQALAPFYVGKLISITHVWFKEGLLITRGLISVYPFSHKGYTSVYPFQSEEK